MGSETRYLRRKDEIREKAGKRIFRRVVGDGDIQWSFWEICILVKIRERFSKPSSVDMENIEQGRRDQGRE